MPAAVSQKAGKEAEASKVEAAPPARKQGGVEQALAAEVPKEDEMQADDLFFLQTVVPTE
ncbi:hypothetical protein T492DRAFT_965361 [Pavlovales sp. CCMP2436]|nr:hypothetical protein T492DRAFT_965361 [Pavlovales sp. CCMP2436]